MKFYDLCVQSNMLVAESTIEKLSGFANRLGYSGIAVCDVYKGKEKLEELLASIEKVKGNVDIYPGATIQATTIGELKEMVTKVRDKVKVVVVSGGDFMINRAACEDPRVDILLHPEQGRLDNGLDEACMHMAAQNNVAIGIDFNSALNTFRRIRSYILQKFEQNIALCEQHRVPVVVCSGAKSIWDMRAPRDIISLMNVVGMDINKAFMTMNTNPLQIIEKNTKTLEGKRITDGVEIVE